MTVPIVTRVIHGDRAILLAMAGRRKCCHSRNGDTLQAHYQSSFLGYKQNAARNLYLKASPGHGFRTYIPLSFTLRAVDSAEWKKRPCLGKYKGQARSVAMAALNVQTLGEASQQGRTEDFSPDAIMVLAGGQTADGGVPEWVQRRLDACLILHNSSASKCPIVCLGGNTPHRAPVIAPTGHVVHESTSCADYLLQKGMDPNLILKEWGSYDTIGNGYFALVWHCVPRQWTDICIVTSDFHMHRSRMIFEWIFGLSGASDWQSRRLVRDNVELIQGSIVRSGGANQGTLLSAVSPLEFNCGGQTFGESEVGGYRLRFVCVSDAGLDPQMLQTRRQKELQSVEVLEGHVARIRSLPTFHAWFHTEHRAYSVAHQGTFGATVGANLAGY